MEVLLPWIDVLDTMKYPYPNVSSTIKPFPHSETLTIPVPKPFDALTDSDDSHKSTSSCDLTYKNFHYHNNRTIWGSDKLTAAKC